MLITSWALRLFEIALNRYVRLDPESPQLLKPLHKGTLCLNLEKMGAVIYFHFTDKHIAVSQIFSEKIDATITASPLALARYIADQDRRLLHDDLTVEGKVDFVQKVQKLFKSIDIDWEEQLARVTNDHVAYRVGRLTAQASTLLRDTAEILVKNTSEYLVEEARVIVSKEEVNHFCQDVDTVAMAVDRLAARLNYLEKGE